MNKWTIEMKNGSVLILESDAVEVKDGNLIVFERNNELVAFVPLGDVIHVVRDDT